MTKLHVLTKIAGLLWNELGRKTLRVGPIDQAIELAAKELGPEDGITRALVDERNRCFIQKREVMPRGKYAPLRLRMRKWRIRMVLGSIQQRRKNLQEFRSSI